MGLGWLLFVSGVENNACAQSPPSRPIIQVADNNRYLAFEDGQPFFWLGGTVWGMSEWLTREEVDYYFDDRQKKGFTVVQLCLFWGKREDDPVKFSVNPPNAYGHRAFLESEGKPLPTQPKVVEGGTPEFPNDYWDHVEYIVQAAQKRNMLVALLPVWGRRYVNATHKSFSEAIFSESAMQAYGIFLGKRFLAYSNIIWILGGDVKADDGGDYLDHYRAMAEGIINGITGETIAWNEASPRWDYALMTYHPDGAPMRNSSHWFHNDPWLDFNMIETFNHVDSVYSAVRQDYILDNPVKPTVMAEPGYEQFPYPEGNISAIQMRRQAYQSLMAGAAGFTYGGFRDSLGNGPLFSPFNDWKKLLDWEGARSMQLLKEFCQRHAWPAWSPLLDITQSENGEGELQKVGVISERSNVCLVYFPDRSEAIVNIKKHFEATDKVSIQWYNPATGGYSNKSQLSVEAEVKVIPPPGWADAVLILKK